MGKERVKRQGKEIVVNAAVRHSQNGSQMNTLRCDVAVCRVTCFVGHVGQLCDDDSVLGPIDSLHGIRDHLDMALRTDRDAPMTCRENT